MWPSPNQMASASAGGGGGDRNPPGMSPVDKIRTIVTDGGDQLTLKIRSLDDPPMDVMHYPMTSNPQGFCIVINNVDFCRMDTRDGSDIDSERLSAMFHILGFKVDKRRNLKASQMKELLKDVAVSEENDHVDALVVVILTHGLSGILFGVDEEPVHVEYILGSFDNDHAPRLQNKPKMFFIQACRGKMYDYGAKVYSNSYDVCDSIPFDSATEDLFLKEQLLNIPLLTHVIVAYSTKNGYKSFRNIHSGSWFGNSLVSVMLEHAHDTDLLTMLHKVEEQIQRRRTGTVRCNQRKLPCKE